MKLLKQVKGRWASLPLDFCLYLMKKDIEVEKRNVKKRKKLVPFKRKMDQGRNGDFHLLSRLRTNITLYAHTPVIAVGEKRRRGRPRKYGDRLGSVDQCAEFYRELAQTLSVFFYGKQRVCSPIRELSC